MMSLRKSEDSQEETTLARKLFLGKWSQECSPIFLQKGDVFVIIKLYYTFNEFVFVNSLYKKTGLPGKSLVVTASNTEHIYV